ncbi:proenkephalin-B [Astyanax mexicanus]|uniref:proenkephalin-B n=1 Tax=Astyanax mexicanus TaxID=7994 RepID=UPI0020CACB15|nr:proenkephalin-B [Astyanax mexicanus]XP_022533291.2 proenkephalin-B [Astyanax mexicanus]
MEWCVLVLVLTLPSLSQAGCSEQCIRCIQQISTDQNSPVSELNSPLSQLTCALECEGALQAEDGCEEAVQALSDDLKESRKGEGEEEGEEEEDEDDDAELNLVKRYGGFIKRLEKNKSKLWPWRENSVQKGLLEKQRDSLLKLLQRSSDSKSAAGDYGRLEKRYGGFRRKFGPKRRSSPLEESSQEQQELQKRYGGFMRRIRPKLKWDNQKRYGGFLRRHFKISVRSEEEPSVEEQLGLLK